MSQLEITSCGEQIDISVFEDLSIAIPDEFNGQSITVPICQDSLVVSFSDFDPTPFPAFLFAAGEQGVWYDPSDLSTMFQDSAGTTPVTAVEQPVGRILDKSGRGNHATQATSASRPVLSARVNLLTYSEQFENAVWGKTQSSVTPNTEVAPDGTTTADSLIEDSTAAVRHYIQTVSSGITAANTYTVSIYAKPNGRTRLNVIFSGGTADWAWFDLSAVSATVGTGTGAATITAAANGFYRCSFVVNATGAASTQWNLMDNTTPSRLKTYNGNGTSGVYIWGADIRVTNTGVGLPAYQRIAAATDYDTTGFPLYLRFDGTDDSLATATFTPGTDKVQVFAGARKLSDTGQKIIAEMSATIASNAGAFALTAPNSAAANYNFSTKGTIQTDNVVTTYTAPITSVISGLGDIVGASNLIRVNGSQVGSVLTTQGTGNYLAYPLYIGRRGGSTLPFNGNIYSLIVRFGANLDATTISNTETWVNGRTMAY